MHKKTKGSVAELIVAARFMEQGYEVLFPYGENARYDLVAHKKGSFIRVQVKFVTPRKGAIQIGCRSSNNWSVKSYTSDEIDMLAAYSPIDGSVYLLPIGEINRQTVSLRLEPAKNNQVAHIRPADHYLLEKLLTRLVV